MGARLVVDLSNKSAHILDTDTGSSLLAWSGVTRRTAVAQATEAGWTLTSGWELTSPPDGFWCTAIRTGEQDGDS